MPVEELSLFFLKGKAVLSSTILLVVLALRPCVISFSLYYLVSFQHQTIKGHVISSKSVYTFQISFPSSKSP